MATPLGRGSQPQPSRVSFGVAFKGSAAGLISRFRPLQPGELCRSMRRRYANVKELEGCESEGSSEERWGFRQSAVNLAREARALGEAPEGDVQRGESKETRGGPCALADLLEPTRRQRAPTGPHGSPASSLRNTGCPVAHIRSP